MSEGDFSPTRTICEFVTRPSGDISPHWPLLDLLDDDVQIVDLRRIRIASTENRCSVLQRLASNNVHDGICIRGG